MEKRQIYSIGLNKTELNGLRHTNTSTGIILFHPIVNWHNHTDTTGTGLIRGGGGAVGFVRLCVTINDYGECLQMSDVANGTISCVKARDK